MWNGLDDEELPLSCFMGAEPPASPRVTDKAVHHTPFGRDARKRGPDECFDG